MFPRAGACAGGGNTPGKRSVERDRYAPPVKAIYRNMMQYVKTFHWGVKMSANLREVDYCYSLKDWVYLNLILKGLDLSEGR